MIRRNNEISDWEDDLSSFEFRYFVCVSAIGALAVMAFCLA